MDFVVLALWDHGPCTLAELSALTSIPQITLRDHLRLHAGDRYLAKTTTDAGFPCRRWELAPTLTPKNECEDE